MLSKKIVILGHFGVGKSSLIRQFVENTFSEDYKVTIGVHILKKEVVLENSTEKITLVLWDLEGNDDINKTRLTYLLGTHAFIYVYDVTRPETYITLEKELLFFEENYPTIPVKVVGNKKDLVSEKIINEKQLHAKALTHIYTSAKTGKNVETLFNDVALITLN